MPFLNTQIIKAVVLTVVIFGCVFVLKKIEDRGYNRAATHYQDQIEQMREANIRAIEEARIDLETNTRQLNEELASNEAKLKEILDDKADDFSAGCGAPVRALRLLDQIR